MTHDELIAYIDDSTNGLKHKHIFEKLLYNTKALRAVVELHKPFEIDREGNYNCQECEWEYPCSTIQGIEKEIR